MTSRKNLINKQKSTLQPATLERISRLAVNGIPSSEAIGLNIIHNSRIVRRLKKKQQRKNKQ
jgi:uncharacterized protein YoaH (UPF0181 family)